MGGDRGAGAGGGGRAPLEFVWDRFFSNLPSTLRYAFRPLLSRDLTLQEIAGQGPMHVIFVSLLGYFRHKAYLPDLRVSSTGSRPYTVCGSPADHPVLITNCCIQTNLVSL